MTGSTWGTPTVAPWARSPSRRPRCSRLLAPPKPAIVWKPIPFGAQRKAEMAAYARRHYGIHTWRLTAPKVIVEHYTASDSFSSAYNTFAADVADSELHELPGTCAHFVIDRDGTIYQLVSLTTMCRHTVGLNYTAIGIEHVGHERCRDPRKPPPARGVAAPDRVADGPLRHPAPQRDRAQREPHEPVPPRAVRAPGGVRLTETGTMPDMTIYRGRLAALAKRYRVPLGPAAKPVDSHLTRRCAALTLSLQRRLDGSQLGRRY